MATLGTIRIGVDATEARRGAEQAKRALEDVGRSARAAGAAVEEFEDALGDAEEAEEGLGKETEKTSRKQKEQGEESRKSSKEIDVFGKAAMTAGKAMAGFFASISAGIAIFDTLRTLTEFEDGLVGVGKTTDISGEALERLGAKIVQLGTKTRSSTQELLEIAQAAGQLGVQGEEGLLAFTETIAKLGTASDLVGGEAASQLARMLTVTGEAATSVGTLGAVIVSLGNNMAATESEIAHTSTQVALATAVFGTSSAEASALGATLAAMGIRAELAGSSMGRSLRAIDAAIREGGDRMASLEKITGESAENITKTFRESAVGGLSLFLDGLKRVSDAGGDTTAALDSLGLQGEEVLKVIPALALNSDELARALELANEQVRDATALNQEADRGFDTLGAQTERFGNAIDALQISLKSSNGALKSIATFAGDVVFALAGVKTETTNSQTAINAFAIAVKALTGAAVGGAIFALVKGFIALKAAIVAATAAAGGLTAVLSTNALGLALAALGAIAFAFMDIGGQADMATDAINRNIDATERLKFSLQSLEDIRAGRSVAERRGDTEGQVRALQAEANELLRVLNEIEKEGDTEITAARLGELLGTDPGEASGRAFSAAFMDAVDAGLSRSELLNLLKERGLEPRAFDVQQVSADPRSGRTETRFVPKISDVPKPEEFAFSPSEAQAAAEIERKIAQINTEIERLRQTAQPAGEELGSAFDFSTEKIDKAQASLKEFEDSLASSIASTQRLLAGQSTAEQEQARARIEQQVAQARKLLEAAGVTDPKALEIIRGEIELQERLAQALRDQTQAQKEATAAEKAAAEASEKNQQEIRRRIEAAQKRRDARQRQAADEMMRALQAAQQASAAVEVELELIGKNNFERERYLALLQQEQLLRAAGVQDITGALQEYEAQLTELQTAQYFEDIANSMASTVGQGIRDLIQGTKDFETALADTAQNIGLLVIDKALIEPLVEGLAETLQDVLPEALGEQATEAAGAAQAAAVTTEGGVAGGQALAAGGQQAAAALTGGGQATSSVLIAAGSTMQQAMIVGAQAIQAAAAALAAANAASIGSAKGNVFSGGNLVPFAYGGIVQRATTFPMADGRIGLMGEAGPEAILPLKRDAQGRLGVSAGGSQTVNNITNVTMNVRASDADSFRRSRRQIAQDLRNL